MKFLLNVFLYLPILNYFHKGVFHLFIHFNIQRDFFFLPVRFECIIWV